MCIIPTYYIWCIYGRIWRSKLLRLHTNACICTIMLLAAACTNSVSQSEDATSNQDEDSISTVTVTSIEKSEDTATKINSEDSISPTKNIPETDQRESQTLTTDIPPTHIVGVNPTMSPIPSSSLVSEDSTVMYIIDQSQSNVSYGVGETFLNQNNRYNYAEGVTNIVSGEIIVNFAEPALSSVGDITVDIKAFKSDKTRRDNAIRDRWLESNKFPIAIFTPMQLKGLPEKYIPGDTVHFEIDGNLSVRNTIRPASFSVKLNVNDDEMLGQASTRLLMTDFGFDPPDISGILKSENEVDITFVFLARAIN